MLLDGMFRMLGWHSLPTEVPSPSISPSLAPEMALLLIGAGSGGPPRGIASELGVWVSGFEANHRLAALANERSVRAGLGRRAQVTTWDPRVPKFPLHYYHHGMALEPLRGCKPEPTLAAVSLALKPGGQLVLVEIVADLKLDAADPAVAAWVRLDRRPPDVPSELAITRVLGRLGSCGSRLGRLADGARRMGGGVPT